MGIHYGLWRAFRLPWFVCKGVHHSVFKHVYIRLSFCDFYHRVGVGYFRDLFASTSCGSDSQLVWNDRFNRRVLPFCPASYIDLYYLSREVHPAILEIDAVARRVEELTAVESALLQLSAQQTKIIKDNDLRVPVRTWAHSLGRLVEESPALYELCTFRFVLVSYDFWLRFGRDKEWNIFSVMFARRDGCCRSFRRCQAQW